MREHRSIDFKTETDRAGRFEWRSAPNDVVLYAVWHEDYMGGPLIPLKASEREHAVILYPKTVISGRVTDAQTGRPIPNFRLVKGRRVEWREEIIWTEDQAIEISSSPYKVQFDEASKALLVRVEAQGISRRSRGPSSQPRAHRRLTSLSSPCGGCRGSFSSQPASPSPEPRSR